MFKRILVMCLAVLMCMALIPKESVLAAADADVYTFDEVMQLYKNGKGVNIVPSDWDKTFTTEIQGRAGLVATPINLDGSSSTTTAAGVSVSKAIRLQTTALGANAWSSQLYVKLNPGVKKGDIIFFGFKMRGIESVTNKESTVVLTNTRLRVDGTTSTNLNVEGCVSDEWQQYFMAVASPVDSGANGGKFVFQLGMALQTIDVADVFAIDFGQSDVTLSQLPIMKTTYKGMEDDAQWRKDALERIEQIRKADVSVNVTDEKGNAIKNAEVAVNQTRHAYGFGSIVNATDFYKLDAGTQTKYLNTLKMIANRSGFENELKMNYIAQNADKIEYFLNWFKENGMDVRGHVLIYGQWSRLTPEQKVAMIENPQLLKDFTLEHIKKYVTLYKDRIYNWDVVNENMTANDFTTLLGDGVIDDWFKEAHKADPNVKLTLNDYGILSRDKGHQDYHYNLSKTLIDHGAPITTIGIQGHVSLIPPEDILTILDRFAALGKEIEITEFTFASDDTELQAKFTRDFLISVFSHPATTSIVTWGFWEGSMYEPKAAMFKKDFSIKPNGQVWMDMIYKQWWTNEKGVTDASGNYKTRAFLGDHKVTVKANGHEVTFDISLGKEGKVVDIAYENGEFKLGKAQNDPTSNNPNNNKPSGTIPIGIRIIGNQKVGNDLIAELIAANGSAVTTSATITYEWYRSSSSDFKDTDLVGEDNSYKLVDNDGGKYIKLKATVENKAFESTTSMITKKSSSSRSSSSSSNSKASTTEGTKIDVKDDSINKSNQETISTETWQNTERGWKYIKNGKPAIGWNQVGGHWYLMDSTGIMETGWKQISGTWYLLKNDGAMATSWQEVNRKWYYLYSDGSMASNTVIDDYRLDESGAWI
jgi:GH35 family endo-1,4-beta-xylanase